MIWFLLYLICGLFVTLVACVGTDDFFKDKTHEEKFVMLVMSVILWPVMLVVCFIDDHYKS